MAKTYYVFEVTRKVCIDAGTLADAWKEIMGYDNAPQGVKLVEIFDLDDEE